MNSNKTANKTLAINQDERLPVNRFVLFFALMVLGLSADLITKEVVFQKCYLPGEVPEKYWLIDDVFGIETSTNGGALFGMGQGKHQWFAALSVLAITALCTWLFVFKAARDRFLTICLGVISGGILGNLFDRVGLGFREGYLEDR